jgi:predicted nuclease of predicted toxin-antitoxin system
LKRDLKGYQVSTVAEMGWNGKKNGILFALAEGNFDVLVTVDKNMRYQQNITGKTISVILLNSPSSKIDALRLLVPKLLVALQNLQPGQVVIITP